jgi:hypothetical protein
MKHAVKILAYIINVVLPTWQKLIFLADWPNTKIKLLLVSKVIRSNQEMIHDLTQILSHVGQTFNELVRTITLQY